MNLSSKRFALLGTVCLLGSIIGAGCSSQQDSHASMRDGRVPPSPPPAPVVETDEEGRTVARFSALPEHTAKTIAELTATHKVRSITLDQRQNIVGVSLHPNELPPETVEAIRLLTERFEVVSIKLSETDHLIGCSLRVPNPDNEFIGFDGTASQVVFDADGNLIAIDVPSEATIVASDDREPHVVMDGQGIITVTCQGPCPGTTPTCALFQDPQPGGGYAIRCDCI